MKNKLLAFLFFLFASQFGFSNNSQISGSFLKIENRIKKGEVVKDTEIEKLLAQAATNNFNEGLYKGSYLLGINEYYKSNFKSAAIYLNNSLKTNSETNVTKAECYRYLGKIETIESNLPASFKNLMLAKKAYTFIDKNLALKDHQILNNDVGYYYLQIEDYNNAYKLFNENLKKSKFNEVIADTYLLFAITSRTQKDYDKAFEYYNKALDLFKKNKIKTNITTINLNIGILLYETKKYDLALKKLNEVLTTSKKDNFNLGITKSHIYLSKIYSKLKNHKASEQNLNAALKQDRESVENSDFQSAKIDLITSKGDINEANKIIEINLKDTLPYHAKIELLEILRDNYKTIGNYLKAFEIQKTITQTNDVYFKYITNSQLQAQKIVAENEILEKEVTLLKIEETKRKETMFFIILVLILLFSLITYSFFKKRHTNKLKDELYNSQILLLEKEKLTKNLELDYKNKEITNMSLFITEKNQALSDVKKKIKNVSSKNIDTKNEIKDIIHFIDNIMNNTNAKAEINIEIENNKKQFEEKLTLNFPNLNDREIRVACLIIIGFTSKQIASHLNITPETVDNIRYLLRKKLNIPKSESILNYLKTKIQ